MDFFGPTIKAGALILNFLQACCAFSSDAEKLKTALEWDFRAIRQIRDYLREKQPINADRPLPAEDQALLEQTSKYLDELTAKLQQSCRKLERGGFLGAVINRAMWIGRKSDIQELERELFNWTGRFGVRVLGLPEELRFVIRVTQDGSEGVQTPPVVESSCRLQQFLALASDAKQKYARSMLLDSKSTEKLVSEISISGDISNYPVEDGQKQLILSSRTVSAKALAAPGDLEKLKSEMGELAAALSCLDPTTTDIRLLKVDNYLYVDQGDRGLFLFVHTPPYEVLFMKTLEQLVEHEPFPKMNPPLNQCLKLAYKLAEAVFFLHTAGFLHKNITTSSIVLLEQSHSQPGAVSSADVVDEAYLMGFDLIREADAITYREGSANRRTGDEPRPAIEMWKTDVFQHPDRLQGQTTIPRYVSTYDVYSLGVVLLEIGLWRPLPQVVGRLDPGNPSSWPGELLGAVPQISSRMGERYRVSSSGVST